ncbi:SMP-30/gluconolactonase/LRE family protein [Persephonella sp.]
MIKKILMIAGFIIGAVVYAEEVLVWPPPPDQPRIKWVQTVARIEDMEKEKGFFSRLFEAIFGEDKKKIIKPMGSYVRGSKLYFTDTGAKGFFIYDTRKKTVKFIDHIGDYGLSSPVDIAVDKKGRIFVSDSMLGTVFITNEDGEFLGRIGGGVIIRPTGLAIDDGMNWLYITDTVAGKIYVISLKDKKLVRKIGKIGVKEGEFNRPTYITVDRQGRLYVSDSMNARIQIFDRNGNFLTMFGERGTSIGTFANPRGIAVDSDGNIYVSDTLLSAIQIFNIKGELLLVFGNYGTKNGEFAYPEDITITKNDLIFVSDSYNMRIQVFKYLKGGK